MGIGVMALSVAAPSYLAPHIKQYKERVRHAKPVGQIRQRSVAELDDGALRLGRPERPRAGGEIAAGRSSGPISPYLKDQTHLYEQLVDSWGGVPEHLKANFSATCKADGDRGRARGGSLAADPAQIASALWNQIDADTLVERGVLVAGDPESCLRGIAIHEEAGVDELQFLMATETVPHDKVMTSIEMFGKHVIPELKKKSASTPTRA